MRVIYFGVDGHLGRAVFFTGLGEGSNRWRCMSEAHRGRRKTIIMNVWHSGIINGVRFIQVSMKRNDFGLRQEKDTRSSCLRHLQFFLEFQRPSAVNPSITKHMQTGRKI